MKERKGPKMLEAETVIDQMNFKAIKLISNNKIAAIKSINFSKGITQNSGP